MIDKTLEEQEKELYQMQRQKISLLTKELQQAKITIDDLEKKYQALSDDYQHNLKVIAQRDEELDEITVKILELKKMLDKRNQEYIQIETKLFEKSEQWHKENETLKLKCDNLKKDMKYSKQNQEEEVQQLRNALKSTTYQLENLKNEKQLHKTNIENKIKDSLRDLELGYTQKLNQLQFDIKALNEELNIANIRAQKLEDENLILNQTMSKEKIMHSEAQSQYQGDVQMLKQKLQQQQLIMDQLKRDIGDQKDGTERNEKTIQSKLIQLSYEKQQLEYQLLEIKQQKKQKIRILKDDQQRQMQNLQKEWEEKNRKLDYQLQQLTIEYEKQIVQESNLKDKLAENESKLNRIQIESEQRVQQQQKNQEQDKKQFKNEIEHKQFQNQQLTDENTRLKSTIQDSNKLLDNLANKVQELKSENKILIDEVVQLRKQNDQVKPINHHSSRTDQKQIPPKKNAPQFLADQEEAESYEKLFSDDEGPIQSLYKGSLAIGRSNKQQLNHSKVKILEGENQRMKQLINDMAMAMENTKDQLMLKIQEANIAKQNHQAAQDRVISQMAEINRYKEQVNSLQLKLRDNQDNSSDLIQLRSDCEQLQKKLQNSKEIIIQLRKEREKLLEITNDLNQKIGDLENSGNDELIHMQTEIKFLQNQIKQLQQQNQGGKGFNSQNQKSPLPNLSEIQNQLFQ